MKIYKYSILLIALFFLGLFFSTAQTNDSLLFRQQQDSTDINAFLEGNINHNTFWKQHVLSNDGGPVLFLDETHPSDSYNFKSNAYRAYIPLKKKFIYNSNYKFTQIDYRPTINTGQFISVLHTQSFQNFSFGLFYQKLISEGQFSQEYKDHVNTEFRIAYHPLNKRFHSAFSLSNNTSKVIENGGLLNDSIYINDLSVSTKGIDVRLSDAENELNNIQFDLKNEYFFINKDSLRIKLVSNTVYHSKSEHFTESNPVGVNAIAEPYYPFIADSTGTNDSIIFRSIRQRFSLDTETKENIFSPFIELEKDFFELGYGESDINLLKFGLNGSLFQGRLKGEYIYKFQTGINSGMYINAEFTPLEKLTLKVEYDQKAPDLFFQRYKSNHFEWNNNFSRINALKLNAKINFINKHTTLNVFFNQMENYVYLNSEIKPIQANTKQLIAGLELNSLFEIGKFTFQNQLRYQKFGDGNFGNNSEIIQLPNFIGRFKIAYKNKMFGEALVQPGIQINYSSKYYAPNYMAPLSTFYLQREKEVGGAILIDFFVNMKISSFTLYAMYNNILHSLIIEDNFTSPHYIGPIQQFNFGIRWNFYDK